MAAFAVVEVFFAESALPVVTGHAALGARVGEMLHRHSRADLTPLRQAPTPDGVTALAIKIAAYIVGSVAKAKAKGARGRRCRSVAPRTVARPARRDVASS